MKINFLIKFFAIIFCFVISVSSQTVTRFKLAGVHSFQNEKVSSWSVTRELIDEVSGKSEIKENFCTGQGQRAEFDLSKVGNKETIYHIKGTGENFTQKYRVRVFQPEKVSSFLYKSNPNPDVRTYIFVPATLSSKTRVIMVMHGLGRNADDYIASWEKWAGKNDYIVIAPNFDNKNWKGSRMYNLGNILTGQEVLKNREEWSFQVVADIFKNIRQGFGLEKEYFDMFGHSAGGQFVHRFMFLMAKAPVRLALAANSGWYTLPDLNVEYPYGYKHPKFSFTRDDLINYSKRHVFILRGTGDTERTSNLRKTSEADAQGENRFKRAEYMYRKIRALNPKTNWRLIDVPEIGHSQKGMAPAAQELLEVNNKNNH